MISNKRTHYITGDMETCIDAKVHETVLKTHAKESIALMDYGHFSVTNAEFDLIERMQFTECDILPFHDQDINCTNKLPNPFAREASVFTFSDKKIDFECLANVLNHAYGVDEQGRKAYPSAGGLYPIEPLVFVFQERTNDQIQSGCYHFRARLKKLQPIKKLSFERFFNKLLHGMVPIDEAPCFCVLYVAHLGKTIFKYRYRGYRHAVMECGAMYQQATIAAQNLGLRSTAWSSFSDYEMAYALDLDPATFLPITMQLFGYREQ